MNFFGIFSKIIRKLEGVNLPKFFGIFSSLTLFALGIGLSIKSQVSWIQFSLFILAILALIFTKSKFFGAHCARLGAFLVFEVSSYVLGILFPKSEREWFGDCLVTKGGTFEIVAFISVVLAYLSYFAIKKLIRKSFASCSEEKPGNVIDTDSESFSGKLNNSSSDSKNFCGNLNFKSVGSDSICLNSVGALAQGLSNLESSCEADLKDEDLKILRKDLNCKDAALMAFDRKLCFFFSLIARFNKLRLERRFGLGLFFICVLGHIFFGFANAHLYNASVYYSESNGGNGIVGDIYSWHIMDALLFYISIHLAVVSFKVKYFGAKFVRFLTFFTFCVLNLMYGYFYNLNFKKALLVLGVTSLVYLFLRYIFIRLLIITKNGIYGV